MPLPQVQIMSRKACCLCEDAEAAVLQAAEKGLCSLEVTDVDQQLELAAAYGADVPVVLIDGVVKMKHVVDKRELEGILLALSKESERC